MTDPRLNELLKWGVENSTSFPTNLSQQANQTPTSTSPHGPSTEALAALFGNQPSDAELMRAAMTAIQSPTTPLPTKLTAFDNLEQLIEQIDNANNLEPLGMWPALVALFCSEEPELRAMAAWCVGTAVQNNEKAQTLLLEQEGAVPALVNMAVGDESAGARKKAVLAISSAVRNHQPALDMVLKALPLRFADEDVPVDASDMAQIDPIIQKLRENAKERG